MLHAQPNPLVHLSRPPRPLNLRRVLHSQRLISHESARRAQDVAPNLIDNWLERERTYQHLVAETRNLTGLLGNGSPAAAEAANAVTRFERLNADDITCNPERFRDLNQLFTRTDARIASVIEEGAAESLYFVHVRMPALNARDPLSYSVEEAYVPLAVGVQTQVLGVVRRLACRRRTTLMTSRRRAGLLCKHRSVTNHSEASVLPAETDEDGGREERPRIPADRSRSRAGGHGQPSGFWPRPCPSRSAHRPTAQAADDSAPLRPGRFSGAGGR